MKTLTATLSTLALLACSPDSILTPDDCKIERVKRVETMTIGAPGDTITTRASYRVTMEDGRTIYITEAEALAAQADPVAACQELRGRE